jgi:hypothetical protein
MPSFSAAATKRPTSQSPFEDNLMTTEATTETTDGTPPAEQAPAINPVPVPGFAELAAELAAMRVELAELAKAKPAVPSTETPKPAITPVAPDPTSLPAFARIAAGYRK